MTDYKEQIEIYTKYLEKKSNLVDNKYLRLHRWISHVELSIFQVWTLILQVECDFTTWRWFCNLEMICNFIHSLEVILQRGSQLWRRRHRLLNGTHVPKVGFAAHFTTAKWALGCEISHSLMWLSSNGHNFFVSTSIRVPFEAMDSWLPKIWNEIYSEWNGLQKVLKMCPTVAILLNFLLYSSLCFSSLHSWLALAKDYEASKLRLFILMSFPFLCHGFHTTLLNLGLIWWSKSYQKHQNLTQFD